MQTLFYFQAEDGIRDDLVTGVQTCALPIWVPPARADGLDLLPQRLGANRLEDEALAVGGAVDAGRQRSEERRVGKEGYKQWAADTYITKRFKDKLKNFRFDILQ